MEEIRRLAREKHMAFQEQQCKQQEEKEAHLRDQEEKKRLRDEQIVQQEQDELEQVTRALQEWDSLVGDPSLEPFILIPLLISIVETNQPLFTERQCMSEWTDRVIALVHQLNGSLEHSRSRPEDARDMEQMMRYLLGLTQVSIDIEAMDTSNDSKMAEEAEREMERELALEMERERELALEMERAWVREADRLERLEREEDRVHMLRAGLVDVLPRHVPLVSLTKRNIGLTLVELKQLAQQHGEKVSGSKQEVAMRLHQRGLVQFV